MQPHARPACLPTHIRRASIRRAAVRKFGAMQQHVQSVCLATHIRRASMRRAAVRRLPGDLRTRQHPSLAPSHANHGSRITSHKSRVTNHQLLLTTHSPFACLRRLCYSECDGLPYPGSRRNFLHPLQGFQRDVTHHVPQNYYRKFSRRAALRTTTLSRHPCSSA